MRHHAIDVIVPVYNGAQTILTLVQRLLRLSRFRGGDIRVIVCNDGSQDGTAERLAGLADTRLQLLDLPVNGGRANACNRAAAIADAEYLLFLDADCEPARVDYFSVLLDAAAAGADLVYGPIAGCGEGFWSRYLDRVEQRRRQQAFKGQHLLAMTSANLLVRRDCFLDAGGFCDAYRHYGFEDKDLIARLLAALPKVLFEPRAGVLHRADYTVGVYCRKMREAACYTAPVFAARQPQSYRRMAYARLDPDLWWAPLGWMMRGLGRHGARPAVRVAVWAVERSPLPWSTQALMLRVGAALSYLQGAVERRVRIPGRGFPRT